jgi:tetratricopeptide (TPR) repeat protein
MQVPLRLTPSNLSISSSKYSVDRHAEAFTKSKSGKIIHPPVETLPKITDIQQSESELILICLDHLRSLRRGQHNSNVKQTNSNSHDCVTLAIWALNKSIAHEMNVDGNDPYFQIDESSGTKRKQCIGKLTKNISIPSISEMESEFLYKVSDQDDRYYEYDDLHPSNQLRFYKHDGLDSNPLSLTTLVSHALKSKDIRGMSRLQGQEIMEKDPMFQDFMEAVKAKGFFNITEKEIMSKQTNGGSIVTSREKKEKVREEIYQKRYRKVVTKFRQKLVENGFEDYERIANDGRQENIENKENIVAVIPSHQKDYDDDVTVSGSVVGDMERAKDAGTLHYDDSDAHSQTSQRNRRSSSTRRMTMTNKPSRQDVQEAETLKVKGNAAMQQKKYALAKNFYTEALKAAPSGPTSHVYYSNRSAALLSMRNFTEAVWDAERSIKLKPEYPKAHARLGLANFLLGMYQEAVDSYVKAVELEPKNKTSISYLERSRRKLITANKPPDADDDEMSVSSRTSCTSRRSRRSRSKQRKSMMKSRRSTITVPKAVLQSEYEGFSAPTMDEDDACASDFDPTLVETPNDKLEEANRLKVNGNKAMARTQYSEAIKLYSNALRLAPAGPQSHVYFSNRAAALCYLARYEEAELDAERALALHPEFGKAHARLGLSRYFLKDYHGAVEAYESASAYDPDNESNRIYLAKAKFKLGRRQSVAGRE